MVRGGRTRTVFTSVGRGSASPSTTGTASPSTPVVSVTGTASPSTPVVPVTGTASPSTLVVPVTGTASPSTTRVVPPFPSSSPPEVESQHPAADDEGPQLPGRQPCWISGGKIDLGSTSRYITTLVHAHIPGPVDACREIPVPVRDLLFDMFTRRYAFTRPEDLPRARAVWESTAQTNLRKSMWEARDKAMKTTGNRDPMAWLDYDLVWLRRDYWESLCERWAIGPWQGRSQAAKRNRSTHPEKNVHTSESISYATHSQKLEAYDRTMADRFIEGNPQPDLDPEAWVDAAGGPRKGRVYGFGDSLDTTPVLSSFASSIAPPAYANSSAAPPVIGVEEMRTLIQEELRTHFDDIVQQLISAMQGVCPSQPAPQVSITINFIYFE
ncbi:hypothetical protein Taro_009637 [Colocasia esculenta]|uniref:Uncharacterized protein n=1 Tax=Colocasia esculenta TaxID=4460 RepID=A0A843TWV6_COLES|nr:hypothetical protein [Colocasia esculenta]